MESLCSEQGLLRERWCCDRGWWMMASAHRIIAGDAWNLVVLSCLRTLHYGHTLVTYNHIRTTIQLIQLNQLIQPTSKLTQWGLRKNPPGVYRTHPLRNNFLIYTACCCSASNLAFHAFIPPYSPSGCMRITKYSKKL